METQIWASKVSALEAQSDWENICRENNFDLPLQQLQVNVPEQI